MALATAMEDYARKHGAHDLDRLGLFVEMPFLSWGKPEKKAPKKKFERTFIVSFPKSKSGNQDGYFDEEFKRIFAGEHRKKAPPKKVVSTKPPFVPTNPGKLHATPNDFYGCFFIEPPERFSPQIRKEPKPKKKSVIPLRNMMTSPAKKGGPGFVDICLNEFPKHMPDFYGKKPIKKGAIKKGLSIPFYSGFASQFSFGPNPYYDEKNDPPKQPLYVNRDKEVKTKSKVEKAVFVPPSPPKTMGNNHDGCFEPFPEHQKEPYLAPWQIATFDKKKKDKKKKPDTGVHFIPPSKGDKTLTTPSIVNKMAFRVKTDNWKTVTPEYVKNL